MSDDGYAPLPFKDAPPSPNVIVDLADGTEWIVNKLRDLAAKDKYDLESVHWIRVGADLLAAAAFAARKQRETERSLREAVGLLSDLDALTRRVATFLDREVKK